MKIAIYVSAVLAVALVRVNGILASDAPQYTIDNFHTKWFWTRPKEGKSFLRIPLLLLSLAPIA